MTLSVTHSFVSANGAAADPTEVGGPEWNANHTLNFTQTGYSSTRSLDAKLSESLSVGDLLAVGDGATDNYLPLQTMINNTVNGAWTIPAGIYKFNSSVYSDYSTISVVPGSSSIRNDLRGASQSNTILRFAGTGYALNMSSGGLGNNGFVSFDKYANFTLVDNALAQSNNGMNFLERALFRLENLFVGYFGTALTVDTCYTASIENCRFDHNHNGIVFLGTLSEPPNLIRISNTGFGVNSLYGVSGNVNAAIEFDTCDISSNGTQGNAATGGVALVLNNAFPIAGPITFKNCFFENNAGAADILITNSSGTPATIVISGSIFARSVLATYTTNNIKIINSGAGSTTKVILEGNSFISISPYVADAARPFISADANTEIIDLGNSWSENTSRGTNPATHGRVMGGYVAANGTATSVPPQIATARSSAGVYTLTHNTGFGKDTSSYIPMAVSTDATGGLIVQRVQITSATVITVVTTNMAGTLTDSSFAFHVLQLG